MFKKIGDIFFLNSHNLKSKTNIKDCFYHFDRAELKIMTIQLTLIVKFQNIITKIVVPGLYLVLLNTPKYSQRSQETLL